MEHDTIRVGGMSCAHCETTIESALTSIDGVNAVEATWASGNIVVTYDPIRTDRQTLDACIVELGYTVLPPESAAPQKKARRIAGLVVIALALFVIMQTLGFYGLFSSFPEATSSTGYAMLFVIGLLTSVHCVGMCGGINLSQCLPPTQTTPSRTAALKPSLLYNAGRLISYTTLGALVGALGSILSLDGALKGAIQIAAGIFMVGMGFKMLGAFPRMRPLTNHLPKKMATRIDALRQKNSSPFIVGLLNGFMPCGPLQSMQIYALSTGSALAGAASMFVFSLGTIPLMFALGAAGSLLGRVFAQRAMAVGSVFVMALGLLMFTTGLNLSGVANPVTALIAQVLPATDTAVVQDDLQTVSSKLESGEYPHITVQAGLPVQWTITADEDAINGCNNRFLADAFGIEHRFFPGENVIEFIPTELGTFTYSCWMGMIQGTITVE